MIFIFWGNRLKSVNFDIWTRLQDQEKASGANHSILMFFIIAMGTDNQTMVPVIDHL